MKHSIDARLSLLVKAGQEHLLKGGLKGMEKESLRVTRAGQVAQTPHPRALGSALTHPYITTDYSEALLELITPPFPDPADTLGFLEDLHRFVYSNLDGELLWAASMPCEILGDDSIPIAEYGSSNVGRMKHVYRRGLAWRYGRAMQSIAGIHFNYSANEALWPVLRDLIGCLDCLDRFITDQYFGLIRNIVRNGWLVLYLFGSSPALSKSFFAGRMGLASRFPEFDGASLYRPFATSLRMSDIGYRNESQDGLEVSFNSLDEYISNLGKAITTPYPAYEKIGIKVDGEYRQLNANILQISNEYYSPIRPKQIANAGERPSLALKERGVRYVELRSVDLGCAHPLGISLAQMRFLELFLIHCLMAESPPMERSERLAAGRNFLSVACCGRTPGFELERAGGSVTLRSWALELLDELRVLAAILDEGEPDAPYRASLQSLADAVADPEATPSARVLNDMRERGESFSSYGLRVSMAHGEFLRSTPLGESTAREFQAEVEESVREQARIESADTLGFDEFLEHYFSQNIFEDRPDRRKRVLIQGRPYCHLSS